MRSAFVVLKLYLRKFGFKEENIKLYLILNKIILNYT